ncbi:MAG: phospholipid carrier-dependent glycosyltransferase [Candidatus Parcubacteria bacterium]|nr:phospholipid carrier-dependent glycosyltransferase [Candidatus Parcubacteria bacterium]
MVDEKRKVTLWIIVLSIFIFALSFRLWNLNAMGRTWDESAYVEKGHEYINLFKNSDFKNKYWYELSDAPPLARYVYGLFGSFDIDHFSSSNQPVFKYDYTFSRLISAIAGSISAVFVFLIGLKYFSGFVGVTAAIIFSMIPIFLGLSQLATLESFIMLFFTSTVYIFLNFLENFSWKNLIAAGFTLGLALGAKYTNILLIPLLIWIYIIWYFYKDKKKRRFLNIKILYIVLISFLTFFLLWPMPWFHLDSVLGSIYQERIVNTSHSVPEIFFGRLMFVPKIYYIIHFLITTPLLLLILFLLGLKSVVRKNWIMFAIIAWFVLPFAQSFYNFRQHGIRYIIEIYAPFSLIAAIGFDYLVSKFTKKMWLKMVYFTPVFIYMFIVLLRITPYYLDYFNSVVGGTKNVYEKKLFQLGWWGQGIKEAGLFLITNAPKGSKVGIAISQISVLPLLSGLNVSEYRSEDEYDYVMVNYFHVVRDKFDDSSLKLYYKEIYSVKADEASLVTVYERK